MHFDAAFYEVFSEEESLLKKHIPKNKKYLMTPDTIQESGNKEPQADIISIRTQSRIPEKWARNIRAIITRSTGYDHVLEYIRNTGVKISCAYLPDYAARAVAEHAIMMMVALLRKLPEQQESLKKFHRDGLTGSEIKNRRITIIGVGRIGSEIADIASGLRMKLAGVDIAPQNEISKKYSLQYVPLEEGLGIADVAICALPLTNITLGLLNYEKLKLMPHGSIFINIARGEISPSTDILKLLDNKHLSAVGLDVYEYEKELAAVLRDGENPGKLPEVAAKSVNASMELMRRTNVITTPHNAFNTMESVERKCIRTAENIAEYFRNGKFITPIDFQQS